MYEILQSAAELLVERMNIHGPKQLNHTSLIWSELNQ